MGAGVVWDEPAATGSRPRLDGVELATKVRFLTLGAEDHRTELAVFPRVIVPQADRWRDAWAGAVDWQWPLVWLHEHDARTRFYGDLHVTSRHGAEREPVFAGIAFERDLGPHWTLTGECFRQGAETAGEAVTTAFQIGFLRALRRTPADADAGIDLLFAAGRTFDATPNMTLYVGPRFVFRRFGGRA
jgi:hypothetical protein